MNGGLWELSIKSPMHWHNNINAIDNTQINDKYHYTALKLNFDISSYKKPQQITTNIYPKIQPQSI